MIPIGYISTLHVGGAMLQLKKNVSGFSLMLWICPSRVNLQFSIRFNPVTAKRLVKMFQEFAD